METRDIAGWPVSAIGLGGMPMSIEGRPDEQRSIATIHAALDMGVSLIDTADSYCISPGDHGHNERLIAKALRSWSGDRDHVMVATKGGLQRPGTGLGRWIAGPSTCARPARPAWSAWRPRPSTSTSFTAPIRRCPWPSRWEP